MQAEPSTTNAKITFSKIFITWAIKEIKRCKQCKEDKICRFRLKNPKSAEPEYVCSQECCDKLIVAGVSSNKYFMRRRKFLIEEKPSQDEDQIVSEDVVKKCLHCNEQTTYQYFLRQDQETFYICSKSCLNEMMSKEPDMFKLKSHLMRTDDIAYDNVTSNEIQSTSTDRMRSTQLILRTAAEAESARHDRALSFIRRCAECLQEVRLDNEHLAWETMDFCNYECLEKYQHKIGSHCRMCQGNVPFNSLGKYCVRFGFNIRQFCCATCLNDFKKGLKTCFCCQRDIPSQSDCVQATVGQTDQYKDFCSETCMQHFESLAHRRRKSLLRNDVCGVCNNEKPVRVEFNLEQKLYTFCSNPCFSAFKFVNNIVADQCELCYKYFQRILSECYTIYIKKRAKVFCSQTCFNVFMANNRYIVPCQWCKVKKYNFDMIVRQEESQDIVLCSLKCLSQQRASLNVPNSSLIKCDQCHNMTPAQYQLDMSDDSLRFFCTYQCVMQFQGQFGRGSVHDHFDKSSSLTLASSVKTNKSNGGPFPIGVAKRVKCELIQQTPLSNISVGKMEFIFQIKSMNLH